MFLIMVLTMLVVLMVLLLVMVLTDDAGGGFGAGADDRGFGSGGVDTDVGVGVGDVGVTLVMLVALVGMNAGGSQLVDEARKQERLLWYTSVHPDTPLHSSLPLNTAVALPVSLSVFRRDLCFVFFAEDDVNVSFLKKNLKNKTLRTFCFSYSYVTPLCMVPVTYMCAIN